MKNSIATIFILLFVFILSNCTTDSNDKILSRKLDFTNTIDEFKDESIEAHFVALETNQHSLIGVLDKVEIFEDRIYILDISKSSTLFVFTLDGNFITTIGKQGNGPEEYNIPFDFSIDKINRIIIIDDPNLNKMLYYDLDTYKFLNAITTPYLHSDLHVLTDGCYGWFDNDGIAESKYRDYFMVTDSLFNPITTSYPADFKSGYTFQVTGESIYSSHKKNFIYHPLKPEIYEVTGNGLKLHYSFKFNKDFPPLNYLKKTSANNANYTMPLMGSDYINGYGVYETNFLLCIVYIFKKQAYIAIYDKVENKRYHNSYPEFVKKINLGIPMIPIGKTEEYLIGKISTTEFSIRSIKNEELRQILKNVDENSNPILCLFRFQGTN